FRYTTLFRSVGHGSSDRLPDPPGGVGGELITLGVVELLHRADQAEVALLDQVQEQHAAAGVALGQGDHEPEVRLQEVVLRPPSVLGDPLQLTLVLALDVLGLGELDRKSTRLNSSHVSISYAVFCVKTKHFSLNDTISS